MLWLCLYFPDLALEVFTRNHAAPEPFAISAGRGRDLYVVAVNAAARRGGVRPGMSVRAAYAHLQSLHIQARDSAAERAALARLAVWAEQFTSQVSVVPTRALLLEVAGSRRLFGGLPRLREHVCQGLAELGYHVRCAVAPTPLGAEWLARAGSELDITELSQLPAALAPLSLAPVSLNEAQRALLIGIGVRTLGDCLRLPREGLARRVGPEWLLKIDQALGRVADPRPTHRSPLRFSACSDLPAPVDSSEALLFVLHRLTLELCGALRAREAGAQSLQIEFRHARRAPTRVRLSLVAPSRDALHWMNLLRERLERIDLPAAVEEVAVDIETLRPLPATPQDLFDTGRPAAEAWAEFLERLQARLGRDAVHGLRALAEHRPERAWAYCPVEEVGTTVNADSAPPAKRPLWLLPEPQLLDALDGHRELKGALHIEAECERIESGWWDDHDIARDYFIATTPGGARLWVFRELYGARRWFLHGIFA